jgi:hypothetical protein
MRLQALPQDTLDELRLLLNLETCGKRQTSANYHLGPARGPVCSATGRFALLACASLVSVRRLHLDGFRIFMSVSTV